MSSVNREILDKKLFPMTFGGEHSITPGCIEPFVKKHKKIWFVGRPWGPLGDPLETHVRYVFVSCFDRFGEGFRTHLFIDFGSIWTPFWDAFGVKVRKLDTKKHSKNIPSKK